MRAVTSLIVVAVSGFVVGCSARVAPAVPAAPLPVTTTLDVPVAAVAPQIPLTDPIDALIAQSERHFVDGQRELELGHLAAASALFDKAVYVLLASPLGGSSEPRLRAHYDRLLSRISALEILALREGDGFTQAKTEPAVIDDLLAVATLDLPDPSKATSDTVVADLAETEHALPIELNDRILSFIELFQGNLRDFMQESLHGSARYLPMVQSVFRTEGLPLDLAYLAIVGTTRRPTSQSTPQATPSLTASRATRRNWRRSWAAECLCRTPRRRCPAAWNRWSSGGRPRGRSGGSRDRVTVAVRHASGLGTKCPKRQDGGVWRSSLPWCIIPSPSHLPYLVVMLHRHLNHQGLTLAAIDDVIGRGKRQDWAELRRAALRDREILMNVLRVCRAHVEDPFAQRYHFWKHYAERNLA